MNILIVEMILSILIVFFTIFITKELLKNKNVKEVIVKNKIFHPNSISIYRIPMWLLSIILFYYDYEILSIVLFTFAAISDAVDWMIARECNLTSELWKSLDPLADKLVYFAPIIYFWIIWKLNIILVIVLILIDTLWQFSRIILKKLKLDSKANNYWKFKTTFIFILIFYLMVLENKGYINIEPIFNNILLIFSIIFAILSIVFKFVKKA